TPPFWRSAFAKRIARSAACAASRSGLYRRSLLDIVIDAEAGSFPGAGPRDVLSAMKASAIDQRRHDRTADWARGESLGLRSRARGDDRRHLRPDPPGHG